MTECEHIDCADEKEAEEETTNERRDQQQQHHQIENCDTNSSIKTNRNLNKDKSIKNNRLASAPLAENDRNNNTNNSNSDSGSGSNSNSQNVVNGRCGETVNDDQCPVNDRTSVTTNNCDNNDVAPAKVRANESKELNGKPRALPRQSVVPNGAKSNSVENSNRPKPILSNGSLPPDKGDQRQSQFTSKKSVSFDTSNDSINKFISGDVIVDKENPFKRLNAQKRAEFFSPPKIAAYIRDDEFVTKEDVLKESKYVKTYIKNPDEYFVYDPTIKEKLLREEARERAEKQKERNPPPKKTSRISRLTHERLEKLKNKYSPPPLYGQSKIRNALLGNGAVRSSLATIATPNVANGYHVNGGADTTKASKQQQNKKKIDRSKYPELSQIKVKVGTDLEGSFFNPKEVALNVKKFDARIKKAQFGSQDDLDEITDLTSTFTPNGREEPTIDLDETDHVAVTSAPTTKPSPPVSVDETKNSEDNKTHTFTNTVNSKEFQEYLKQKGLTLLPDTNGKKANHKNGDITLRIIEPGDDHTVNEMDAKKSTKKASVLQRLFPNGIFSSRRKTTPKEVTPEPKRLGTSDDSRLSVAKRLVLHRQSLPPQSTSSSTVATATATPRAQPSLAASNAIDYDDDRSSSISSALTNAENDEPSSPAKPVPAERRAKSNNDSCSDFDATKSLSGIRYIDSSSNSTIVACDAEAKQKPVPRLRHSSGRSSVPVMMANATDRSERMRASSSSVTPQSRHRKETPLTFENKTPDIRDGIVKPRVCRPQLIGGQRYVDPAALNASPKLTSIASSAGKRVVDRPPALVIPKKSNENGKLEAKKRMPPKLPERKTVSATLERNGAKTPTLNEPSNGPKSTSTPIADNESHKNSTGSDFYFHPRNPNVSPIARPEQVCLRKAVTKGGEKVALDPWSDRQLYSQPLLVYTNAEPMQNVYERVPVQQPDTNGPMAANAPLYAKVEKRTQVPSNATNFVRQTPLRQSLDQNSLQQRPSVQPTQPMEPTIFVRSSPQRNTITGGYNPQMLMRMPGASYNLLMTQQQLMQQQQPPRAQSVLDEMINGGQRYTKRQFDSVAYQNIAKRDMLTPNYGQNVVLRRKPGQQQPTTATSSFEEFRPVSTSFDKFRTIANQRHVQLPHQTAGEDDIVSGTNSPRRPHQPLLNTVSANCSAACPRSPFPVSRPTSNPSIPNFSLESRGSLQTGPHIHAGRNHEPSDRILPQIDESDANQIHGRLQ